MRLLGMLTVYYSNSTFPDNAYDARAKSLHIDIQTIGGKECLIFMDDGHGMDPDELFKMLRSEATQGPFN